MKLLGIQGSLRANSSNHTVMEYISQLLPADVELINYRGLINLPQFDGPETLPPQVEELRSLIASVDGVIICTPEYAFGVPGALKNALDWTVGQGDLMNKPTALITASTGGQYGHPALLQILQALSADVGECHLLISGIRSKLKDAKVSDAGVQNQLADLTTRFLEAIKSKITSA
jgi:chromate reductase, NAD(P)H dehydrogenase (quinone)